MSTHRRCKAFIALGLLTFLFFSLGSNASVNDSMTWHSSLTVGTELSWRCITYQVGEDDTTNIGDKTFELGSILKGKINSALPTDPDIYFEGDGEWGNLFVDGEAVNMSAIGDEGYYLLALVNPISYDWENGTVFSLFEYLSMPPELDAGDTYEVNQAGNNVIATFYDDSDDLTIIFSVDGTTGITQTVDVSNWNLTFHITWTIWADDGGDDGGDDDNDTITGPTLEWHSDVSKGAEITWKCVTYQADENDNTTIGGVEFGQDSILKGELTSDMPTDAEDFLEGDGSWGKLYVDDVEVDYDQIEGEGIFLMGLMNPIKMTLGNSTEYDLFEYLSMEPYLETGDTYEVTEEGSNYVIEWYIAEDDMTVTFAIDSTNGVSQTVEAVSGDMHFKWEIQDLTPGEGDNGGDGGDGETSAPGFEVFTVFIASVISTFVIKRFRRD